MKTIRRIKWHGWMSVLLAALLLAALMPAEVRALAPDTDLSAADASFWGEVNSDNSGDVVAPAGDVNGDGFDDIIIGANMNDENGSLAGQVYLILGKATGWTMDTGLSAADASFIGESSGDTAGYSIASAGDVDNDGYDDILIGANGNDEGGDNAGQVYLILGKATGWAMDTSLSTADASFWGEVAGDGVGFRVASAGDVNNDGYDDILIGTYLNDDGPGTDGGQVYLIMGKATGWAMDTSLSTADASFIGEASGDRASKVASAGDVNNDGYDDILIGAYYNDDGGTTSGQTYLILGKATGWTMDTSLSTADASFIGEASGDRAGNSLSSAGDVNGDGYDDILIGANGNDEGGDGAGQVYLILGKASGWAMDNDLSAADASFIGENASDSAGTSVAPAGDVNGDTYADILIGAPYNNDGGSLAGQTYLILGKATGWAIDTSLSTADASFIGERAGDRAGYSVASAGDVNGDTYADIIIGAYNNDDGPGTNGGQTYLILGNQYYIDISNTPGSNDFGIIGPGGTTETVLIYFTVSNASLGYSVKITIGGSDMTGGTYIWTLSDTAAPGADTYGLKAGLEGGSFNIVVRKTVPYNTLVASLDTGFSQRWGLQLLAPTSFSVPSEETQKSASITLTATLP